MIHADPLTFRRDDTRKQLVQESPSFGMHLHLKWRKKNDVSVFSDEFWQELKNAGHCVALVLNIL